MRTKYLALASLSFALALPLGLGAAGCKDDPEPDPQGPELRLGRDASGYIVLEMARAPVTPRAVEAEIVVEGSSAVILEDARPPQGSPIDTVRVRMRGTNRAILFTGDKRGIRLAKDGVIARFRVSSTAGSGTLADARLRIERAVVVDTEGKLIDAQLGGAIAVR